MPLKKRLFISIYTLAVLLLGTQVAGAQSVNWKIGFGGAPNDPNHQLLELFIQKLDAASSGRFKAKVVFTAPLGYGSDNILRYLKLGLAEAGVIFPNYLYKDEPMVGVILPNGVLLDMEDNEKLFPVVRETLDKIYGKWGVELRAPVIAAIGVYWTLISKKPINSLEQLRGVKIRHMEKTGIQAFNKLGVAAQFINSNETYMALKTGVIEGATSSRLFSLQTSMYEVTKYSSELYPYSTAVMPGVGVSKKAWAKLPPDLQLIWEKVAKGLLWDGMYAAWKNKTYEIKASAGMKAKGMVELDGFSREDRKKIQQATLVIWREECEKIGPEAVAHYNRIVPLIPKD